MTTSQAAVEWFRSEMAGFSGKLLFDELLSKHTYYRIGGAASVYAVPRSLEDLQWLARGISKTQIPFFVMGMGSNLLVSDSGFQGLIIRVDRVNLELNQSDAGLIRTGSSVAVSSLLRRAASEGWGGLEFLTGIPGSVGGVVFMNAGTHLGEAQGCLQKVEVFDLNAPVQEQASPFRIYHKPELKYEYRKNHYLPKGSIVWAAEWAYKAMEPKVVKAKLDEVLVRRKSTQPLDYPSCGSVFKNPKESGMSAWQVVDQLKLRGHRVGGAQFSEKHSNFIVNLGGARASDVLELIHLAKSRAQNELKIQLEEEVIFLF